MENIDKTIGIIGGGQLGKMMILEAKKMGFSVIILDPTEKCPAHTLVDEHIIADFDDKVAIRLLAEKTDVITYEFEHIDADILSVLEKEGVLVYPTAKSLKEIQNKFTQKTILLSKNLPVPDFCAISSIDELKTISENYKFPFMLKTCTGGYDGKGNFIINAYEEITKAYECLGNGNIPLMAERFYPFIMEVSILTCRGIDGEVKVYPVAENIHKNSILSQTRVPANISEKTTELAMKLAREVMEIFEGVGMFCVELFVDKYGNLAINEIAPRPHNSGHYTIEACMTSQFEQHIRAVTALPLGSPSLLSPVVMENILGEEKSEGVVLSSGIEDALSIPGVTFHLYGKETSRPNRKMGHITVLASTLDIAIKNAGKAKNSIKIFGQSSI